MNNNFSKLGFILATLGSSIGLGHIWRFPYMAGEYGGSAFVLVYIILTFFIGIPILVAKMVIGNKTQKNVLRSFEELDTTASKHWKKANIIIISGPLILSFYTVVLGWVCYYLFVVSFNLPSDIEKSGEVFGNLVTNNIPASIITFAVSIFLTGYIVSRGVKNGLEAFNFVLMPLLFIIFIGLFFYALTLPSFSKATDFLFSFDISKITPNVVIMALSQVFFSLSIGIGIIITYASSAAKGENLLSSSTWIAISGIVVSLVAGLIIFTFLFEYGQQPNEGTGMLFKSLPLVLSKMSYGWLVSFLFFSAVLFAGITSTISVLEPSVAYISDEFKIGRVKTVWLVCSVIFILGVFVILSLSNSFGEIFTFFGIALFDWIDFITSAIFLPLSALTAVIFLTYVVKKKMLYKFVRKFMSTTLFGVWYFIIKYVSPLVIVLILIAKFANTFYTPAPPVESSDTAKEQSIESNN